MEKFSETQKQVLITNLARAFSALCQQHTKGYTLPSQLPISMTRKFQEELNIFHRTMGNLIAQRVVNAYEEAVKKSQVPTEAVLKLYQKLYGSGYIQQKANGTDDLGQIEHEVVYQWSRLSNLIRGQEWQYEAYTQLTKLDGYPYFLYISEQMDTTCIGCRQNHGKVYSRDDLQGLDMIPPIHPNCQCSLVAMDNWLYQVYNRNNRELLPYLTGQLGAQGGLFYIDHNAAQLGINHFTVHPVPNRNTMCINHSATSGASALEVQWLEKLKRNFIDWGTNFGQDAVLALETIMVQGQTRLQQAELEENSFLSLLLYADFFALNVPSNFWNSCVARTARAMEDPSVFSVLNCFTLGLGDLINNTVFPEEAFSFDHVCNMIGLIAILYGAHRLGETLVNVPERLPEASPYMTVVDDAVNVSVLEQAKLDVENAANQAGKIYDTVSADAENQMARQLYPNNLDSFTPSTDVLYVTTTANKTYVRVYGGTSNAVGRWFMNSDDIAGLSPAEIQQRYALDYTPTYICEVTVPASTNIKVSHVNAIFGQPGGGVQYCFADEYMDAWFADGKNIS